MNARATSLWTEGPNQLRRARGAGEGEGEGKKEPSLRERFARVRGAMREQRADQGRASTEASAMAGQNQDEAQEYRPTSDEIEHSLF